MNPNEKAFLDTIKISELGQPLIDVSDDGYNVIVGSTAENPHLFTDYSDHPRKLVDLGNGLKSTAAGAYQILAHIFDYYKEALNLPDFSKESQDKIALQLISECKQVDNIDNGDIVDAIKGCASRWASLPGSTYGQHVNEIDALEQDFRQSGGTIGQVLPANED